jgi:hypothetical protein
MWPTHSTITSPQVRILVTLGGMLAHLVSSLYSALEIGDFLLDFKWAYYQQPWQGGVSMPVVHEKHSMRISLHKHREAHTKLFCKFCPYYVEIRPTNKDLRYMSEVGSDGMKVASGKPTTSV